MTQTSPTERMLLFDTVVGARYRVVTSGLGRGCHTYLVGIFNNEILVKLSRGEYSS